MRSNTVTLIGNVDGIPETVPFSNGSRLVIFNLQTKEPRRDKSGKTSERCDRHRVVCFDAGKGFKLAARAENLAPGDIVIVQGALRSRSYEHNGRTYFVYEVEANDFRWLSDSEKSGRAAEETQNSLIQTAR